MTNSKLAKDYFWRAKSRHKVLQILFDDANYADCIRESQELVELLLKGLLRLMQIDPPHWHDVSQVLQDISAKLPNEIQSELPKIKILSSKLRRYRETAFYGDDDLIPSESFTKEEAQDILKEVHWLVNLLEKNYTDEFKK